MFMYTDCVGSGDTLATLIPWLGEETVQSRDNVPYLEFQSDTDHEMNLIPQGEGNQPGGATPIRGEAPVTVGDDNA